MSARKDEAKDEKWMLEEREVGGGGGGGGRGQMGERQTGKRDRPFPDNDNFQVIFYCVSH